MKRYYFIVFFIVVFSFFPASFLCNSQEIFLQANKNYNENQYTQALELYDSIEKKGRAVWYNMGNCYYMLNKYAQAVACWKRAESGANAYEYQDINKNIEHVYKKLGKDQHEHVKINKKLFGDISLVMWQILFLLFLYSLFFCIKKRRKHFLYTLCIIVFCNVNMLIGLNIFLLYQEKMYPYGVIIVDQSSLYSGPNQRYHTMGTMYYADQVKICENRSDDWCKVYHHDGRQGWVVSEHITIV